VKDGQGKKNVQAAQNLFDFDEPVQIRHLGRGTGLPLNDERPAW
jgi:hypothetical protein